jgi:glycosyltransferase involved in cell wall biosynthesis
MRVAYVFNDTASGGGSVQARTLIEGFHEHGIDVWGVQAINLNSPETFVSEERGYPMVYPSTLADGLKEIEPDIVFVHGFSPELNSQLRDLSEDLDAQFILRKGMNLLEHWFAAPSNGNPEKITCQVSGFDWYDCIVCPTEMAAERVSLIYRDNTPQLAHVPNAIDRESYVPTSYMQNGWLHVVMASRVCPNNYTLAPLLAVCQIMDSGSFPVKLDVFGNANGPLDSAIRGISEDYDNIEIHGHVPGEQVRETMEQSDVVCVPSFSHQAVPLAALEGMAAGNVVLGSFPEAQEEQSIIRVPPSHPPAWKDAISDAYHDEGDARDIVSRGIEAAAEYNIEGIIEQGYKPVFEQITDDS